MTLLNGTMTPIETVTVGAGGQSAIEFTNIPQTYTDLCIMSSIRGNQDNGIIYYVRFNGDSGSNYSYRYMLKDSSSPTVALGSANSQNALLLGIVGGASPTSSTFSNDYLYMPNYTNSSIKSVSADIVMENNSTMQWMSLASGLWNSTAAINSIRIFPNTNIWIEGSSATLYGVTSAAVGAKATGGIISQDTNYFYHTFLSSGTFTPTQNITAECLVVAGGGGTAQENMTNNSGGAGAGGYRLLTGQSMFSTIAYTITVGAGGAGATSNGSSGNKGNNSSVSGSGFSTIISTGGGRGVRSGTGGTGGSGAGGESFQSSQGGAGNEGAYNPVEGYAGGQGREDSNYPAGGGGGAGGAGQTPANNTSNGGNGGIGSATASAWGLATGTGQNVNGIVYYAGGGGGGSTSTSPGVGGAGGGASGSNNQTVANGLANTGGGAGGTGGTPGQKNGASGGSGIVIIRYPK